MRFVLQITGLRHEAKNGTPAKTSWTRVTPEGVEKFYAAVSEYRIRFGNNEAMVTVDDSGPIEWNPLRELKHLNSLRMIGNNSKDAGLTDLSPLTGLPLQKLGLWAWSGTDLSPLKGMPLNELNIGGNGKAMDLTALAGAPLEYLCLNHTQVSDISPLKGMPLNVLLSENSLVSDLNPIRGAQLIEFAGDTSRISDITPLSGMPLKDFHSNVIGERKFELLEGCKTLEFINSKPAAEVLREVRETISR